MSTAKSCCQDRTRDKLHCEGGRKDAKEWTEKGEETRRRGEQPPEDRDEALSRAGKVHEGGRERRWTGIILIGHYMYMARHL